jgi:hypothetical protein
MSKYGIFLLVFVVYAVAMIVFLAIYINQFFFFFHEISSFSQDGLEPDPWEVMTLIFTAPVLISGAIMIVASLLYRVLGIVYVANSEAAGGEKALWIVGFCILGFITGIVFLVLAKSRKLV